MNDGRYVVLGLARPRASWFSDVSRWATASAAPLEFIRCVSAEEVRARLGSGRAFSALLVDGGAPGLDRDLCDRAREGGAAVLVVDDGATARDWTALEASAVLLAGFSRTELVGALDAQATAVTVVRPIGGDTGQHRKDQSGPSGTLVALLGPGGTGVSLLSMALAQAFADHQLRSSGGGVVLADMALHADLAMLHDAPDIVPGITELVDAHRAATPSPSDVAALTFAVADRGYHLLLGLRRHRDWAALRPRAVEASVASLRRAFAVVVADTDADLEGEDDCGAVEVEERNVLARTTVQRADVVFAVGTADLKGTHALARSIAACIAGGVDAARIVPVINGAPRQPRRRAEQSAALASLVGGLANSTPVAGPLFIGHQRRAESCLRDGTRLPSGLGEPLLRAGLAVLARHPAIELSEWDAASAVKPGSLGTYFDERAAS